MDERLHQRTPELLGQSSDVELALPSSRDTDTGLVREALSATGQGSGTTTPPGEIRHGPRTGHNVAFTFHGQGDPVIVNRLLDELLALRGIIQRFLRAVVQRIQSARDFVFMIFHVARLAAHLPHLVGQLAARLLPQILPQIFHALLRARARRKRPPTRAPTPTVRGSNERPPFLA